MQGHPEQLTARRAVVALAVPLLAGLLAVAACQVPASSTTQPGPSASSGASPAAVEWVDRLCGVILDYDGTPAKIEVNSTSPDAAIESLKGSLTAMSGRIDETLGKLTELGQAPVPGGDEAATGIVTSLRDRKTIMGQALTELGRINVADRTAATRALQEVVKNLQRLKTPVNPLEGMGTRFPELQAAARSADNCTEITRVRASRSAFPPSSSSSSSSTSVTSTPPTTSSGPGTDVSTPPAETTYPTY